MQPFLILVTVTCLEKIRPLYIGTNEHSNGRYTTERCIIIVLIIRWRQFIPHVFVKYALSFTYLDKRLISHILDTPFTSEIGNCFRFLTCGHTWVSYNNRSFFFINCPSAWIFCCWATTLRPSIVIQFSLLINYLPHDFMRSKSLLVPHMSDLCGAWPLTHVSWTAGLINPAMNTWHLPNASLSIYLWPITSAT